VTQQIINIGTAPNDGTGDPARNAFDKSNQNFTELYQVSRPTGNAIEYQFNNTTTEPPASGQIRFNQSTQASTTKLWASHTTSSGVNIKQFLAAATTGAKLVLQDKIDNTNYIKFDVTGAPVDKTTYWEFAVAVTASGGNLPNAAILAAVTAAAGGGTSDPTPPQGRMTLQTATPVMITTQSAKTTIFYAPYVGNKVPIYDGTNMVMTTFAELSVVTTDTTKSPAAIGASKVNDWFVWSDAGTIRVGHGPDWTSDTARSAGTALVMVNGILLNNASITNGPAAQRGTYVGTTRSNGSAQLDWIYGAAAAGGTAGFFSVWNAYNRKPVASTVNNNTDSWTYNVGAWRQANASPGMQTTYVCGLVEEPISALYGILISPTTTNNGLIGIGVNSTTSFSGTTGVVGGISINLLTFASYNGMPGLGANVIAAIEYANIGGGIVTYYGDLGVVWFQTGFTVNFWA
jgi:hypothetical protein